jgi:hypothetical protein
MPAFQADRMKRPPCEARRCINDLAAGANTLRAWALKGYMRCKIVKRVPAAQMSIFSGSADTILDEVIERAGVSAQRHLIRPSIAPECGVVPTLYSAPLGQMALGLASELKMDKTSGC